MAEQGQDAVAFFAASVEETRELSLSTSSAQISDINGALQPGRYLLLLRDTDVSGWTWIKFGKFVKGGTLTATVGPGVTTLPLSRAAIIGFEVNINAGENDRIAAVNEVGGGTLYMIRISRPE
jgi:hypothetical protein